jgi:hypothetical protein
MLRRFRFAAVLLAVTAASPSIAQTPKPRTPGEMAAADKAKAEKTASCRAKAKEQKLTLSKRRAFVKDCVGNVP